MIIGIDLGTTNSAVAIWRDGQSELVPNALGELRTPSAVSIDDDGQSWVGRAALEQQVRTLQSFIDAALRLARYADATVVTGQSP